MTTLPCHFRLLPLALAFASEFAHSQTTVPPQQTQQLDAVQVIGHYDNGVGTSDAASEGSVTAKLIASRPALRPGELLEFVPGVIVTQHSGDGKANQYFLRGFNLDHGTDFATFVDGMPVNMVSHAHGQGYSDLNFLIPELVQRIDYRKGPYFASEGDFSAAGSARMSLVDALPRGLGQLTLGSHGYRRGVVGDSTAMGSGTLLGVLELQGNDGPWQQPENLHKVNGWLRWSQRGEGSTRSVTLMGYDARWTSTDQVPQRAVDRGTLDRFGALDASDGGRTQRVSLSAQQTVALVDGGWHANVYAIGSRLNLFSNFTYALDNPVDGDQFEQAERRRVVGGAVSRRWDLKFAGRDSQFTLGAQLRHDRLSPVGLYPTALRERIGAGVESEVRQTQLGVYGELATPLTPWLRSVVGLRVDTARFVVDSSDATLTGRANDTQVSPKLSLIAGPWAKTEFFANVGRGFHSNDARGTTGTSPDTKTPLVPGTGGELGVRTEIIPGLQSSLALWRLDLNSELLYVGDAGVTEPNRASRRHGIEWNNHWRLDAYGLRHWLLDADLAFSKARFTEDDPAGNRVPGSVNRVASFGIGYGDPDTPWSTQFQLRHFGPRDLTEDGSQKSAGTTLAYLRGGWRFNRQLAVNVDVFNLFDRRASDIDYFYESQLPGEAAPVADRHFHPVEPRSVRVTLSLQWR
jgi:hypothetical protein